MQSTVCFPNNLPRDGQRTEELGTNNTIKLMATKWPYSDTMQCFKAFYNINKPAIYDSYTATFVEPSLLCQITGRNYVRMAHFQLFFTTSCVLIDFFVLVLGLLFSCPYFSPSAFQP